MINGLLRWNILWTGWLYHVMHLSLTYYNTLATHFLQRQPIKAPDWDPFLSLYLSSSSVILLSSAAIVRFLLFWSLVLSFSICPSRSSLLFLSSTLLPLPCQYGLTPSNTLLRFYCRQISLEQSLSGATRFCWPWSYHFLGWRETCGS